jgi:hypothetical protein
MVNTSRKIEKTQLEIFPTGLKRRPGTRSSEARLDCEYGTVVQVLRCRERQQDHQQYDVTESCEALNARYPTFLVSDLPIRFLEKKSEAKSRM